MMGLRTAVGAAGMISSADSGYGEEYDLPLPLKSFPLYTGSLSWSRASQSRYGMGGASLLCILCQGVKQLPCSTVSSCSVRLPRGVVVPGVEGGVLALPLCISRLARFPVVLEVARSGARARIERVDRLENEWRREGRGLVMDGLCEGLAARAAMFALRFESSEEPMPDPYEDGPAVGEIRPGEGHAALSYPNSVGVNCNGGNMGANSLALPLHDPDPPLNASEWASEGPEMTGSSQPAIINR